MARAINPAALREIRELVGISQRELARRCGINQATVCHIEGDDHGVSPTLIRKLADALGCSVDAITQAVVREDVPA
jgi:transcriptional regulator with XRE-family HTH domain